MVMGDPCANLLISAWISLVYAVYDSTCMRWQGFLWISVVAGELGEARGLVVLFDVVRTVLTSWLDWLVPLRLWSSSFSAVCEIMR
jgi:hypothetical protein